MKSSTASFLLLIIIYLAYISLGLPDSVLGIAWPYIRLDFHRPLEAAGILTILLTICSATSSIFSGHALGRFGIGRVTFVSCLMTAVGLLGYSVSPSFYWLLPCVPLLGFGAGSIDCGLNFYVAANYSSRYMNWLHCCWGIGATAGPMILTACIAGSGGWRAGYRTLGFMQLSLSIILFAALGLWVRVQSDRKAAGTAIQSDAPEDVMPQSPSETPEIGTSATAGKRADALRLKAMVYQISIFALYASCEFLIGLWAFSLLTRTRGISPVTAGIWVSVYYGALTLTRFATGFVVNTLGNRFMIRLGLGVALIGVLFFSLQFFIPPASGLTALAGLILMGAGFAPVYPCMSHETTRRFREDTARKIMGYQVGAACLGASLFPALVGFIGARTSLEILPFTEGLLVAATFALNGGLDKITAKGAV